VDFVNHRRGLAAFGEFIGDHLQKIGAVEVGHVGRAIFAAGRRCQTSCDALYILVEPGFLLGGQLASQFRETLT
jgi:hypothetical protein